jgi:UDP-N-acetylglucosamine transferase subunit ALG13
MILVLLGTHPANFSRIIDWALLARKASNPSEKIVIQHGETKVKIIKKNHNLEFSPYFEVANLQRHIKKARRVICHAGPGLLQQVWMYHKYLPIVIPRRAEQNEHVSTHQEDYAQILARQNLVCHVKSITELTEELKKKKLRIITSKGFNYAKISEHLRKILFEADENV